MTTPNEQTCPTCGEDGSKPYSVCSDAWHLLASETGYEAEIIKVLGLERNLHDQLVLRDIEDVQSDWQYVVKDLVAMLSKAEVAGRIDELTKININYQMGKGYTSPDKRYASGRNDEQNAMTKYTYDRLKALKEQGGDDA